MQAGLERYFRGLLRRRRAVLAGALVLLASMAAAASRVQIDYSVEQFFPAWDPVRRTYQEFKRTFPKEDTQISLFWQEPHLSAAAVQDMRRAARIFEAAGLREVRWLGNVEVGERVEVDGRRQLHVRPLIEPDRATDAAVHAALARHRDDPLLQGYLWDSTQTVFAIHGYLDPARNDDRHRQAVERRIAEELTALEREARTLVLSGIPVLRARILQTLRADQAVLLMGGLLTAAVVLFVFLRHGGQVVLCLLPLVPAYVCVLGLMALLGRPLTVLTGSIPIVVLVVGLSDAVHLLVHYRAARKQLDSNAEAVVGTFSALAVPCFYTSLTTAVGFLSLVSTGISVVVDYGVFTAIAILVTFAFIMTLLPIFLSWYRIERFDGRGLDARWMRRTTDWAVGLTTRPRRAVVGAFGALALFALGVSATLRINAFMIDDLREDHPLQRDIRWVEGAGFGLFQVNLYLKQTGETPLHHPRALAWMERFQQAAEVDSIVVGSVGLPDFLRAPRAEEANGAPGRLPRFVLEALLALQGVDRRYPDLLRDIYRRDRGEAQVVVLVRDAGSAATLPLLARLEQHIADDPPPMATAALTGTVKLAQTVFGQMLRNLGSSLMLAVGLIFAIMVYLFRSVKLGALALLPNLFPLAVLGAAMRLGGFDLKPSTILIFSIVFGIAVDDTIHLLAKVQQAIRAGRPRLAALSDGLRSTAHAILMTSTVIACVFGVLMVSRFEVMFLIGALTLVSVVAATAADLFLFPTILRFAWGES